MALIGKKVDHDFRKVRVTAVVWSIYFHFTAAMVLFWSKSVLGKVTLSHEGEFMFPKQIKMTFSNNFLPLLG